MTSQIEHFFINDAYRSVYFTAVVFPAAKVIASFPANPNGSSLNSAWARRRFEKLIPSIEEREIEVSRPDWQYYEVSPYPERQMIYSFRLVRTKKLFSTDEEWADELATPEELDRLDSLARSAGLPTIGEYYREIQVERAATKSYEKASHEMVSSWTELKPTETILAQLKDDLESRYRQVQFYTHGWHYVVYLDGEKSYYRTPSTETMLRSFIVHAEEAARLGIQVRFSYCLPEYMPEGIEWKMSPVQD